MKPEYGPLVDLILQKKVKKKGDLKALSMPPPLGSLPPNVPKDVALEFVKVYLEATWKVIHDGKEKKSMLNLRKHLKAAGGSGSATSAETPAKATAAASKIPPASAKPKIDPIAEMKKKGMTDDQILREKGLSFERRTALKDAFDFYDTSKSGHISKKDLTDVFAKFEKTYDSSDIDYLIGMLTSSNDGTPSETLSYIRFALFMESMMGDAEAIFNSSYHLFTHTAGKPKEISKELLLNGMKNLNVQFGSKEADDFLKKGKTMKDFSKQLTKMMDDKPPQLAGGGGSGAKKKGGGGAAAKAEKPKVELKIDSKDPKYKKYFKMKAMHLPAAAAIGKAKMDGLSEAEIEALTKALS